MITKLILLMLDIYIGLFILKPSFTKYKSHSIDRKLNIFFYYIKNDMTLGLIELLCHKI